MIKTIEQHEKAIEELRKAIEFENDSIDQLKLASTYNGLFSGRDSRIHHEEEARKLQIKSDRARANHKRIVRELYENI